MEHPSESIESLALADLHAAAPEHLKLELGLQCVRGPDALLSVAAALPVSAIVVNRCLGLGLSRPATRQAVENCLRVYRDAGVTRHFLHLHPQARPPVLAQWLQECGFERARAWQKFSRATDDPVRASTELEVREAVAADGPAFGRIVCRAFDLGERAEPWLAQLPGRSGWHVFMSFDGGQPCGTGALFVVGGVGWLDWGATDPDFRRRGSQAALLARRVARARELGCRTLYTCTGEAVGGDAQHSYHNIQRAGFHESYLRANYQPRV